MGRVIQFFVCFALIGIDGTSGLRKKQSDVETLVKEIKIYTETEIQLLKYTLDTSVNRSVNEIIQSKLEDLELQISFLRSNVEHCRCGIKCEATWTHYHGFCYKHFNDKKSHDEAKQACAHTNSFLVDVKDQQEMNFLTSLVDNATIHLNDRFKRAFWLGLTDTGKGRSWIWDRTGVKATYLNWIPGEPSDYTDETNCAMTNYRAPYDKWGNMACSLQFRFVCKKK